MSMSGKRRIHSKPGLIPVSVGDRVRAVFEHWLDPENQERVGVVTRAERRYGHHGNFVRTSPLLYVRLDGKDELDLFDQGYVAQVIEHRGGPERPHENVFRDSPHRRPGYWRALKSGIWEGDLVGLTCHVLASHHARITHPLDDEKLERLFWKDRPGFVKSYYSTLTVRSGPFKRWVKQNYSKFLATTAELDRDTTRENEAYARLMDDDFDFLEESESERETPELEEGSYYDPFDDLGPIDISDDH